MPVQRNARHQLQQVEIVPAINWHILDLLSGDGTSGGRNGRLQKGNNRTDFHGLIYGTDLQRDFIYQSSVERYLQVFEEFGLESVLRRLNRVSTRRKRGDAESAVCFRRGASLNPEFWARDVDLRACDCQSLLISNGAGDRGSRLC